MALAVTWTRPARKDLAALDRQVAARIVEAVNRYAVSGRGDVTRLRGERPPDYRLRVGRYRVILGRREDELVIVRVRHRREAYR